MFNLQTDEIAEDHAVARVIPVLKSCKAIQHLLPSDPRKMGKSGAELATAPLYVQGSTPAQLQSKSVLFEVNDEIWLWPEGRLEWALSRVAAFERIGLSKVLNISQAGQKDDDLDEAYRKGTMKVWNVPCERCGHFMPALWSGSRRDESQWGMVWDRSPETYKDGVWNPGAAALTARYVCRECGHEHQDTPTVKALWNRSGKYVATNPHPAPGHESFTYSAVILESWSKLVEMFLHAMNAYRVGVVQPLVTFRQQRLALPNDPEQASEEEKVAVLEFDVKSDWPEEVVRFMTIDVQETCYWVEVRSWAANGDSRQRFYGRLLSEDELVAKQEEFRVSSPCVFVDVGYHRKGGAPSGTRSTYAMIARRGWCGLKGEDRDSFIHRVKGSSVPKLYSQRMYGDPGMGTVMQGRRFAPFFMFASPSVKNILQRLRDGKGAKWESLPGRDYARQMFAEQRRRKKRADGDDNQKEEWVWVQTRRDNHAFDCGQMQVVAAIMHPAVALDDSHR